MSVMARNNLTAQQRCDLSTLLALDSYIAADLRATISAFTGLTQPYILRGLQINGTSGLSVSVNVASSFVFNVLDGNGSFLLSSPDAPDVQVSLPSNQTTIFLEATFSNLSQAPVSAAYWDPLSLVGNDVAGSEFTASTNSQNVIVLSISANTVGFSTNAVPIAILSTDSSKVTDIDGDARNRLFRLGTGGANPDPGHNFPWSTSRGEGAGSGTATGNTPGSPFQELDATGILNDKGLYSLKDWMDAVMTRFKEITGSSTWYGSNLLTNYVTNLNVDNAFFFSSAGHSVNPSSQTSIAWSVNNDNRLRSHGVAPVEWQSNYANIRWTLGGTFTSSTLRTYSDPKFVSPFGGSGAASTYPVDHGNIYLNLEKDVTKGSGNSVQWGNAGTSSYTTNQAVNGSISGGDFTGIAIGDYIRKTSEGIRQYYQVTALWNGTTSVTATGTVADSTILTVQVDRAISSGSSTEPLLYFRSAYQSLDLYADIQTDPPYGQDVNQYWLGRRVGTLFILRGYGNLEPGQEANVENDAFSAGFSESSSELILEHTQNASYDATNGYLLKTGSGNVITIRRRSRDNTVGNPNDGLTTTPFDNTAGWLTYTIASPWTSSTNPTASIPTGNGLWVRLSDTTGGALSYGQVASYDQTQTSWDQTNTDPSPANRYEDRTPAQNVLRSFDNKDVFLLARRITVGGIEALLFFDGSMLTSFGQWLDNSVQVQGDLAVVNDLYLENKTSKSVLFIGPTSTPNGKVQEDNANFNYDTTLPALNIFNFRISAQDIDTTSQTPVTLFPSLGAGTLTVGASTSTTVISGNLTVLGHAEYASVSNIEIDSKTITLGVGNGLNAGGGSGILVADNTQSATTWSTTNATVVITVNFASAHGYTTGQTIGVDTSVAIGGISEGDVNGAYTFVTTGSVYGDAQVISSTQINLWTNVTATSTATQTAGTGITLRTFQTPSFIQMSDSSGSQTAVPMTSWSFGVKGSATSPTITPVAGHQTVPTANATAFLSGAIPYAGTDTAGPSGTATTLEFNATNLSYAPSTGMLTAQSTRTNSFTQYNNAAYFFVPGTPPSGLIPPTNGINVFADGGLIYQIDSAGNVLVLTNNPGEIYEEPTTGNTYTSGSTIVIPVNSRNGSAQEYYVNGSGDLEIYLNGDYLTRTADWSETGTSGQSVSSIIINRNVYPTDTLTFRIDANGGKIYLGGASPSGEDLQTAYINSSASNYTITTVTGSPVIVTGGNGNTVFEVDQNFALHGVALFGVSGDSNLYRSAAGVLKTDTSFTVGGTLTIGTLTGVLTASSGVVSVSPVNATAVAYTPTTAANWPSPPATVQAALDDLIASGRYALYTNTTGSDMPAGVAVCIGTTARHIVLADNSAGTTSYGFIGFTANVIPNGTTGLVQLSNEATIAGASFTLTNPRVYLGINGTLTQTAPTASGSVAYLAGIATSATTLVVQPTYLYTNS